MCHALIIEDEPFIALDLERLLEENSATSFDLAATEGEAVECAQACCPELIVSDVQLPEETGPLAVSRIVSTCGPLPVKFITGTPDACMPRGAEAVILTNPVDQQRLAAAFQSLNPTRMR